MAIWCCFSIWAAIRYTSGENPYGYRGLGDIYVFLFFGLVGVRGTAYIHLLKLDWKMFFPAFAMGMLATAVLNLNNMRDIHTDEATGKITIPVKLGGKKAKNYHLFLILAAPSSFFFFFIKRGAAATRKGHYKNQGRCRNENRAV